MSATARMLYVLALLTGILATTAQGQTTIILLAAAIAVIAWTTDTIHEGRK